jgi:hypothetical protein
MVFCQSSCRALAGSRQTRPRAAFSGHSSSARRNRRLRRSKTGEEVSAGSARTRRSFRSSRRGLIENEGLRIQVLRIQVLKIQVLGIRYSGIRCDLVRDAHVECRDDTVKHITSPSRRENALRVTRSKVFSKSVCRYRTSCPTLRRRVTSVSRLQHVHGLRVPNRSGCRHQAIERLNSRAPYFCYPPRANRARHAREI